MNFLAGRQMFGIGAIARGFLGRKKERIMNSLLLKNKYWIEQLLKTV